jgi:hypothetical protein
MKFFFVRFFIICLFWATSFQLQAQETFTGKNWQLKIGQRSYTSFAPLKKFLEISESNYISFFTDMGLSREQSRQLKIRVFETKEAFKIFQAQNSKSKSNFAFYSLFNAEIYTWDQKDSLVLMANIFHEGTHHYIREFIPRENIPRCLDEGLAEIFEVGQISGEKIEIGSRSYTWVELLRKARNTGGLKPFTYFLSLPVKDFVNYKNSNLPKLHIAQCWALAHFLVFEQNGTWKPVLKGLLNQSGYQETPEQVIEKALYGGYKLRDIEQAWQSFIKNL